MPMHISDERPQDELQGDDALAAIETQLRQAMPSFHLRARIKGLDVTKARRGVFVDVRFDRRGTSPEIPDKVRLPISRARAESLRHQLNRVLG